MKYSGDQIKKNKIGGASSRYGGEVRCVQRFDGETEGLRLLGRGEMYTGFCWGD